MKRHLKWLVMGPVVGSLIAVATVGFGHQLLVKKAETALAEHGLQWTQTDHQLDRLSWSPLTGPGVHIGELTLTLWPTAIALSSVTVDLKTLGSTARSTARSTVGSKPFNTPQVPAQPTTSQPFTVDPMSVSITDLHIMWGDSALLDGPISLIDPGQNWKASRSEEGVFHLMGTDIAAVHPAAAFEHLTLDVRWGDGVEASAFLPSVSPSSVHLSRESLPENPLQAHIKWDPSTAALTLDGSWGEIPFTVHSKPSPTGVTATLEVPLTPLSTVAAAFGDSQELDIRGAIGLTGTLNGPPWEWTAEPAAKDLAANGALPENMTDEQVEWRTERGIQRVGPKLPGWVSLNDAGWMPEAVIAAEDIRFRTHPGFDLVAIQEALEAAPREIRVRGGSTITQQLAKNLFFDGRRTLRRKLRELLVALALEERMSKDGILALYLNVVNFGPGIQGVGAAANAWFLKVPGQLSPREAAFLASILPAPNMWHRRITETGKPPVRRVDEVLDRMRLRGVLTKPQHARERAQRLRVVPPYGGHESE
jgi:hypothetical protein